MISPQITVLILSPDPKVLGGITSFIGMLTAHLTRTRATLMPVGSLQDTADGAYKESLFALIHRLLSLPFQVAWLAKGRGFDAVHINPSLEGKSLLRDGLILFALRCTGYRHVLVYFHGWRVGLEERLAKSLVRRGLFVWMLNGSKCIAVLAPEFKQGLERMGVASDRIVVTRTMFDGAALKEVMNEAQPQERRSVLFMSRFARKKGVHELLAAFTKIAAEFPDVDLIMAGEGEEGTALRATVASLGLGGRVKFTGYVSGVEKWRLLKDCTLYALPTYFAEGMPVALLEAMAAGKPVLTSLAGGIKHLVSDKKSGVVLASVTVETVTAGLKLMLANPAIYEEAGAYNAAIAWDNYEAAKVTAEVETLYQTVAGA